jgi:hypothetical protein
MPRPAAPRRCRSRRRTTRQISSKVEQIYRLYVNSGKLILAAMYLRRVQVAGCNFAAAPAHVSTSWSRFHPLSRRPLPNCLMWAVYHRFRSLFRYEMPVVGRSASGYRIAPRHLAFTEPTLLSAAAQFSVTSSLAVKPHRCRAWRSHGRYRVRKRSSRVAVRLLLAVAFFPLLDAAAAIHALRSRGRSGW